MMDAILSATVLGAKTLAATSLDWREVLACRTFWSLLLGAIGLVLLCTPQIRYGKTLGGALAIIAAGLLAADMPLLSNGIAQGLFWLLAAITLVSAVGTISSQSPVYAAIWFAMSLLGTAGLFFFNGAQFLGVATLVVYAGAIVVTFLFVIMLAQPEGRADYDRISWGWFPKTFSVLAAATMVGILTMLLAGMKNEALAKDADQPISFAIPAEPTPIETVPGDLLHPDHMAGFGRYLFSRQLISIEIAGTLLLAALVGAVAIAIQGKPRLSTAIEEALQ
jgi:NADH-quinone oxidoreductase subunit J